MRNEKEPATPEDVREALGYVEAIFGPPLNIQRELACTTATVINDCHY